MTQPTIEPSIDIEKGEWFTLGAYLRTVVEYRAREPQVTWGQAYAHVLTQLRPDLAERVWGSDLAEMQYTAEKDLAVFLYHMTVHWGAR